MHTGLDKGTFYYSTEDGEYKEVGTIESAEYIGIDYANEAVELKNSEMSINLEYIPIRKYHRRKKGKRYLIYYYEEITMYDNFLEAVFGVKNKNKKIKKLGSD